MTQQRAFRGLQAAVLAGFAGAWMVASGAYAGQADPCSQDQTAGTSDGSNVATGAAFQDLQALAGPSVGAIQVDPTQVDSTDSNQQPCAAKFLGSWRGSSSVVSAPAGGASSGGTFDASSLFGAWGNEDVFQFPKDGTATTSPRTYSIRMVSFWNLPSDVDNDTPTWEDVSLVDRIAIYDISDPTNIYGKTFDLSGNSGSTGSMVLAGQPFQLDSRPYATVTPRSYTLTIGQGGQVIFTLPASSQTAVNSSGNTLTIDRLRQIRRARALPTLKLSNGVQYYVVPQSAGIGCWQFFDQSSIEPVLFGCVNQKLPGAQETPLSSALTGNEYFGHVFGQSWCIQHNDGTNTFQVVACKMDDDQLIASTADGTEAFPAPQAQKSTRDKKSHSWWGSTPGSGTSNPQKPATSPSRSRK